MKVLYLLRVTIISFEFLILGTCLILISNFSSGIDSFVNSLHLNTQVANYVILLPIGLFVWITKESHELIFSEKEIRIALINWPDYWQLKMHICVSIFYAFVFCLLGSLAWFTSDWVSRSVSLITFATSCIGLLYIAGSIYFAKMSVLEIINKE